MSGGEAKHTALAATIADACASKIMPKLVELMATCASISARLDLLDQIGGAAPPKRATRAAKPASAAKGAVKGANKSDEDKVTNALLFFRYSLKNDLSDYRGLYADDDAVEGVISDAAVAKKVSTKETNPGEFYSTVGAAIWKKMDDSARAVIRANFETWKQERSRNNDAQPLEEEGEAEAEADA